MDYFPSAEAMAAELDLELLLRAEVDRRMLTRKERLSQFAGDATIAGHLYGRVREQQAREKGSQDLRGKILWMTAPYATVEHLSWAVGLADQITRQRGRAYLAASSIESMLPARTGVRGEGLPDAVQNRLRSWLNVPSYAVGTDLEGVRMVVPVTAHDAVAPAPTDLDWTVLLLDPLPEDYDGPYPKPTSIDGVVFVTAFRDHSMTELHDSVAGLRRAGLPLFGVVGMGPQREADGEGGKRPTRRSPSIWRTEDPPTPPPSPAPPKESAPPKVVALPGAMRRDVVAKPSEPPVERKADEEESTWARLGRSGQGGPSDSARAAKPGDRTGKSGGDVVRPGHGPQTPVDATRPDSATVRPGAGSTGSRSESTPRDATPVVRAGGKQASGPSGSGGRKGKKKSARSTAGSVPPRRADLPERGAHTAGGSTGFEKKESGSVWSELPASSSRPHGAPVPPPASSAAGASAPSPSSGTHGAAVPPTAPPSKPEPRASTFPPSASGARGATAPPSAPGSRDATATPSTSGPRNATIPPSSSRPRDAAAPSPGSPEQTRARDAGATPPTRPTESPAPEPTPIPNVTPLPVGRVGAARTLTSEERSVALLTGWQRERQRHAARGSRAAIWISSAVVVLGLVGAFVLMRPSLIASGRLPDWLAGSEAGVETTSPGANKQASRAKTAPQPNTTESNQRGSDWDASQRDEILAELRERERTSAPPRLEESTPGGLGAQMSEDLGARSGSMGEIGAESAATPPFPHDGSATPPSGDRSATPGRVDGGVIPPVPDAPDLESSVSDPAIQPGLTDGMREDSRSDPALLTENPSAGSGSSDPAGGVESTSDPLLTQSSAAGSAPGGSAPAGTNDAPARPDAGSGPGEGSIRITPADPIVATDRIGVSGATDQGASVPNRGTSGGSAAEAASGAAESMDNATGGSNVPAADASEGAGEGGAVAAEPIGASPEIAPDAAYVVHLGSFRLRREADAEVARLMGLGYDARALHVNVPGKGPWYRVVIGAFPTFEAAHENAVILGRTTGRTRPNVVGAGGYGAPVPVQEESESSGTTTP